MDGEWMDLILILQLQKKISGIDGHFLRLKQIPKTRKNYLKNVGYLNMNNQERKFLAHTRETISITHKLTDLIYEKARNTLNIKHRSTEDFLFDYLYNNGSLKNLERAIKENGR